jgi:hypothetical protein
LGTRGDRPSGVHHLGRDRDLPGDRSGTSCGRAAHDLLDAAYALGIRYADAARSYGDAEQFLGSWLDDRRPEDMFVASKWGYEYVGDWRLDVDTHEVKHHDLATFRRQLAESLALLGDRLRLYQVHSLTPDSPLLTDARCCRRWPSCATAGSRSACPPPARGRARRSSARSSCRRRQQAGHLGAVDLELLERSAGPALAAAHEAGCRVVVKEASRTGGWPRRGTAALRAVAERYGVGPDAVAMAPCWRSRGVTSCSPAR